MNLTEIVSRHTGYIHSDGNGRYEFDARKGTLEEMEVFKTTNDAADTHFLSQFIPYDEFMPIQWELRTDFDALGLMGPSIYYSNNKFLIVWNDYMLKKEAEEPLFDEVHILKDFGEGFKKISIGVLPIDKQKAFEDAHKIRLQLHLV